LAKEETENSFGGDTGQKKKERRSPLFLTSARGKKKGKGENANLML